MKCRANQISQWQILKSWAFNLKKKCKCQKIFRKEFDLGITAVTLLALIG